jgi:SAM-dependent methyltransferase
LRDPTVGRELPTKRSVFTASYLATVKILQAFRYYDVRNERYASMIRTLAGSHFQPDSFVLDLGCGPGGITTRIRDGHRLVGLDADRFLLSRFVAPDIPRIQARAERLPIKDGCASVIVAISLVEHIADQTGFFQELVRVLEPGGSIVLQFPELRFPIEPHTKCPLLPFWGPILKARVLEATGYTGLNLSTTLEQVVRCAENAGCRLRRVIPIWHFRLARLFLKPMGYVLLLRKGNS